MSRRDGKPSDVEYRARWAAEHICLRCSHNIVCKTSSAMDPVLRPAISLCRMFEPLRHGEPS